jgi:hypothetical protein
MCLQLLENHLNEQILWTFNELKKRSNPCVLKYMELYGHNDKTMNMQCMKQTSFNAWSHNVNHTKIVQQCMTTLVNAPN